MATKNIPAKNIVTCDACLKVCGDEVPHKKETVLILRRHALDIQGNPAAPAGMTLDLCDECEPKIVTALNLATEQIRKENKADPTVAMGRWRSSSGDYYDAPVGNFTIGQISDTGSRLIRTKEQG